MSFARFYRMATRVWLYGGVMTAVHRMQNPQNTPQRIQQGEIAPVVRVSPGARMVPLAALMAEAPGGGSMVKVKKSNVA